MSARPLASPRPTAPVARYRVLREGMADGAGRPIPPGTVLELRTDTWDCFARTVAPMLERLEDARAAGAAGCP